MVSRADLELQYWFVVKPLAKPKSGKSCEQDFLLVTHIMHSSAVTDSRDYYQCSDHVIFGLKLATLNIYAASLSPEMCCTFTN